MTKLPEIKLAPSQREQVGEQVIAAAIELTQTLLTLNSNTSPMALPQPDDRIEQIKLADLLLERADLLNDEALLHNCREAYKVKIAEVMISQRVVAKI